MTDREAFDVWADANLPGFTSRPYAKMAWQAATAVERERLKAQEVAHHREVQEQVAAERERCAKVCEDIAGQYRHRGGYVADLCAAVIRKGPTP